MKAEPDTTAFSTFVRRKANIAPQEIARAERAEIVKATYSIEPLTPGVYHVQHPIEDERAYLVDVAAGTCDCPDWECRGRQELFRCKHLLAIQDLTGVELPQDRIRAEAQELDRSFSAFIAEQDSDDIWKD